MIQGISLALAACFVWGLIFVVPLFMEGFTSMEVALARFIAFGACSLPFLLKKRMRGGFRYSPSIWLWSVPFSFAASLAYYPFVVLALRYSTPSICALILGLAPVTIAFSGNWKEKECSFRSLIPSACLILLGLVMVNIPYLRKEGATSHLMGILFAVVALVSWNWFAVANSRFIKRHPELHPSDWTSLIGVGSLLWALVGVLILYLFDSPLLGLEKFHFSNPQLSSFLIGALVLGTVCSWVGGYLWNRACPLLPISLAGQLMVFETIFGLLFAYSLEKSFPPLIEALGICLFLAATLYSIHIATQIEQKV